MTTDAGTPAAGYSDWETGAEMIQPVAIVCIGGLLYTEHLTTLVMIPVMYKLFAKKHMEKIKEEDLEIIVECIMCRNTLPVLELEDHMLLP